MLSRMPRQTEPSINNALGGLLQGMMRSATVRSENVRAIADNPGLQPDILVTEAGRAPVIVEAEIDPAHNAEAEAKSRLGLEVVDGRRTVEAVIALRYPEAVADSDDLAAALSGARLSYCVHYHDQSESRFPESGWLDGSVSDLADLVRLVSVSQRDVDVAADALQQGIERAAAILDELDTTQSSVTTEVARLLGLVNVPQTRRMACAIIANALVFHERIAGMSDNEVQALSLVCGPAVSNPKGETLAAWTDILDINYWPIFAVGRDILNHLPSEPARRILNALEFTAGEVNSAGVNNAHDLTGRIFQRLIVDRKYLATFYTLPASAALLAQLAISKFKGVDWSDAEAIGKLRIGDFACGTGALLSAVYEQIAALHERAGGDAACLHKTMMEEVLYGCDVMPAAVHITSSTLSGIQPNVGFGSSRVYTLPYGRLQDDSVAVGSLELLTSDSQMTLANFTDPAMRTGSVGEETAAQVSLDIPHEGFDLVIMNPPFTSDTKHLDSDVGVLNAAFAAFDMSDEDQKEMATRLRRIAKNTAYHGHAGLGSAFAELGHRKLRQGGIVALVLPFTATNGASWLKFRKLMTRYFTDLTIVSIAANRKDMSFSSDTGMAECLVIGRKKADSGKSNHRARFVSLRSRPASFEEATEIARSIVGGDVGRRLEDGPFGGDPIQCGRTVVGETMNAPTGDDQMGWGAARVLDAATAQVGHSLSLGELRLPARHEPDIVPMAQLNEVGKRGLDSQLLISPAHKGPFKKATRSPTATYPSLWNHDAKSETRLVCDPDSQLLVRQGMEDKAAEVWTTATRCHLNRDFTFGSQALAIAFTDQESLGGRVWPNVSFGDRRFDYALSVWGNSTLGLLAYWWHSSRQQSSKAGMTIRWAESLPVLDFRELSSEQLGTAEEIFEDFRDRELKPAYLADADPNRALLDRRVVCDLLGFDEATYEAVRRLSAKWCAEPSVHGGKRRPRGARFVM